MVTNWCRVSWPLPQGVFFGTGYGFSQQKLSYLPIQHTDFIFAIYAEEMGLVGCLLLLALLTAYGWLGMRVVNQARHPLIQLIALGTTVMMLLQALINIGVAIGILPTTGLPFPLFSYGGSSVMASMAIAGLLIRCAREAQQAEIIYLAAVTGTTQLSHSQGKRLPGASVVSLRTERLKRSSSRQP